MVRKAICRSIKATVPGPSGGVYQTASQIADILKSALDDGFSQIQVPNIFNLGQDKVTFDNGSFDSSSVTETGNVASIAGWNILLEQINLDGGTNISGFPTPTDSSSPTSSTSNSNPPSSSTFTYALNSENVQLISSMTTAAGFDVVHGPALVSNESIAISAGSEITFDWRAMGGADASDVYAYLLNTDTGFTVELLNETGTGSGDTGWQNVTSTVSSGGNYKFVFVSGTFDETGGFAAGASLFVDNVSVSGNTAADYFEDTSLQVTFDPSIGDLTVRSNVSGATTADKDSTLSMTISTPSGPLNITTEISIGQTFPQIAASIKSSIDAVLDPSSPELITAGNGTATINLSIDLSQHPNPFHIMYESSENSASGNITFGVTELRYMLHSYFEEKPSLTVFDKETAIENGVKYSVSG